MRIIGSSYEVIKDIKKNHCFQVQKWVSLNTAALLFTYRLLARSYPKGYGKSATAMSVMGKALPAWEGPVYREGSSGQLILAGTDA